MGKAREYHRPLFMVDSLHSYQLPEELLTIIQALHEDSTVAVRAYGKTSEKSS